MLRGTATAALVACLICACGDNEIAIEYPLDDRLTIRDLQAEGTHNSYHVVTEPAATPEWNYTHAPLRIQARDQGVRQFELDVNINYFEGRFEVYHFFRADEGTTCRLLVDCLHELKDWSDANRAHHPIVVLLELKDGFSQDIVVEFFELLEGEIASVWPPSRRITPDGVRGDYDSLRDAVAERGWPTLGEARGSALFVLLADDGFRSHYTHGDTSLRGRLAFVVAGPDRPYAAIDSRGHPIADAAAIRASLDAGLLVRTRIDTVTDDGPRIDPERLDAARAIGAHFLSTDEPEADVVVGTPSRCNPVLAAEECTDLAIEDPSYLR